MVLHFTKLKLHLVGCESLEVVLTPASLLLIVVEVVLDLLEGFGIFSSMGTCQLDVLRNFRHKRLGFSGRHVPHIRSRDTPPHLARRHVGVLLKNGARCDVGPPADLRAIQNLSSFSHHDAVCEGTAVYNGTCLDGNVIPHPQRSIFRTAPRAVEHGAVEDSHAISKRHRVHIAAHYCTVPYRRVGADFHISNH